MQGQHVKMTKAKRLHMAIVRRLCSYRAGLSAGRPFGVDLLGSVLCALRLGRVVVR